jgi:chromosome segregation ATPase
VRTVRNNLPPSKGHRTLDAFTVLPPDFIAKELIKRPRAYGTTNNAFSTSPIKECLMSYKYKSFILFVFLFVALTISGCDRHKAEREQLGKQIAAIDTDLAPMKDEQGRVSQEVSALTAEVQQQSDTVQPHLDQRQKLQDELDLFVQQHQTTALVLNMTRTGVAAVLESKASDKTKNLIKTADAISKLIAVAYCIKKGEECRNATVKITALGSQIDAENQQISLLSVQLDQKKAQLEEQQQKLSSLDSGIAAKTTERDGLKQRLDAIS